MASEASEMAALRPEAMLLVLCARPVMEQDEAEVARSLVDEQGGSMDWAWFLDQAIRQKVLPMVARNLDRLGLFRPPGSDRMIIPGRWVYLAAYESNRRRNRGLFDELGAVVESFRGRGVSFSLRKGGHLVHAVYRDPGIRRMNDLDVLVARDDVEAAVEALGELGYVQGKVSENGRRVEQEDRTKRVFWGLYMANLLPFRRLTTDPDVEAFEVDVCLSPFLPKSGYTVPVEEMLGRVRIVRVAHVDAPVMAPEDMLVDICAHLHKEATTMWWIQIGVDLNLVKFCDVAWFARSTEIDWDVFVERTQAWSIAEPMFFSLHFAETIYPGSVPHHVLDAIRPADVAYLDEYGHVDRSEPRQWKSSFLARLFDPARRDDAGRSVAPV